MHEIAGPILLVEDGDEAELTRWAFARCGVPNRMVLARDGVEALELLLPEDGSQALEPAVVLMDINMPRMNGLEALRMLRADPRTRSLPVVMLSNSAAERDIVESSASGANSYVQKPINGDDLLEVARQVCSYWLGLHRRAVDIRGATQVSHP
ncbi:response regulator [Kineosporia sp. J2-2]|uniref:Response regulator n=1 Tax=Kineosporia corallincola TaxID=2835133 RepID=A0ABS5TE98_9ACTN|nr:response regulator [Kineosporia corallincola]MBT0769407.1 response regulator [Kineosporia corallincola]